MTLKISRPQWNEPHHCVFYAVPVLSMMNVEKARLWANIPYRLMMPHRFHSLSAARNIKGHCKMHKPDECMWQGSIWIVFVTTAVFSVILSWSEQQVFRWEVASWLWNRKARKSPLFAQISLCCWKCPIIVYKRTRQTGCLSSSAAKLCLGTRSLCPGCTHSYSYSVA